MIQLRPNTDTARKVRVILKGLVAANVAVQRFSTRVVVLGDETAAKLACELLSSFGFRGPANTELCFTGHEGRFQIFAYEVRA